MENKVLEKHKELLNELETLIKACYEEKKLEIVFQALTLKTQLLAQDINEIINNFKNTIATLQAEIAKLSNKKA